MANDLDLRAGGRLLPEELRGKVIKVMKVDR
jgi:hypothetical protein